MLTPQKGAPDMPPRKDHSGLPTSTRPPARPPSKNLLFLQPVMDLWHRQILANDEYLPAIPGRPYRGSMAGLRCDRQLFYALTDVERTVPRSIADSWRMNLGSMIHHGLQEILDSLGDGWRREVIVDYRPIGIDGSAHVDLAKFHCVHCGASIGLVEYGMVTDDSRWDMHMRCSGECEDSEHFTILRHSDGSHTWSPEHERAEFTVEFKTVNGMQFKSMATTFRGPPEGARSGHILQGAMSAKALGCNQVIVAYLAMENVGVDLAQSIETGEIGRFAAEWHFTVAEVEPAIEFEVGRVKRLLAAAEYDVLPMRVLHDQDVPDNAQVIDPARKTWVVKNDDGTIAATGTKWFCDYCDHRPRCIEDGAG